MSIRLIDCQGNLIGILRLAGTILVADLETLRRLGTHKIELVKQGV
jgi:hypothetical protein